MAEVQHLGPGTLMVNCSAHAGFITEVANSLQIIPAAGETVLHSSGILEGVVQIMGEGITENFSIGDTISFRATNADFINLRDSYYLIINQNRFIAVVEEAPPPET